MADDYRQRVKTAIDNVLDRPNGMAYRGTLPEAVLAVRDDELKRLRYELEQWHAAYGETALPTTIARLRTAEDAIARVRHLSNLVITTSIRLGAIEQASDTLAALDGVIGADLVAVRKTDLDLVMNHAGDPATVAAYPAAAQRVRDALEGGRHP